MRKACIAATMAVFVAATVFAGGEQEPAPAVDFAVDPPTEATTIDVIGWAFPITEFYAREFGELNAVDNLTVNTQLLDSASAQEQVRLALSGGRRSPYEIVHAANAQISEWGYTGWLMPLDDLVEQYWDEYDLGDIPEVVWDAARVNGKIMGIPAVSNTLHLIYRKDLFEQYGLDVPQTYDDVIEAAGVLSRDNTIDVAFTMNLHAGWAWEVEFLHFLRSFGGDYLNEDNTPGFAGSEGVAALERILTVVEGAMGDVGMSYSIDDSEIGLQTGRLAFANIWASRAVNMNDPDVSDYHDELAFAAAAAPVAGGLRGGSAWNDFYSIPATTDVDPELIFQVIMEAVDLESQKRAVEFGIPTRTKAVQSDLARAYVPAAMQTLADGVGGYQNSPALRLVRTALAEFLPLAGTGELSPQEALERAAESYLEQARAHGFIN